MLPKLARVARKVWFRLRAMLVDTSIPKRERIRRFYQTVDASGAGRRWGPGAWMPSAELRAELDAVELRWLRWMTGVFKRLGDTWVEP